MSEQVMVDIETLGTDVDAVILSIGAVLFDPSRWTDKLIISSFEAHIDPADCQRLGMTIDANTALWWMDADRAEAREALLEHKHTWLDLWSALDQFHVWFGDQSMPVWGNGATFDNVILRNAFERCGRVVPWNFRHDRCHRTFKSLAPWIKPERTGTHHSAVDDAVYQTQQLKMVADELGITL